MADAPPEDLATWLDQDHPDLEETTFLLRIWCSESGLLRDQFRAWLRGTGLVWGSTRNKGLAAVLEAATLLDLEEAVPLMVFVLVDPGADILAVSIAAQRIRRFKIPPVHRDTVASGLIQRAYHWKNDKERAPDLFLMSPSLALAYPEYAEVIEKWLSEDPDFFFVGGIVQGLANMAPSLSAPDKKRLLDLVQARIQQDPKHQGYDLLASLIIAVAAFSAEEELPQVAKQLAEAFTQTTGLSSAAAVSAGQLLASRDEAATRAAFAEAFGADEAQRERFFELMRVCRKA